MKRKELLETAKPILFNSEMVRAILEGRKTVTRRVVKNGNRTPTGVGRDKFYTYVDVLNGKTFNGAGFYRDSDIFQVDGVNHTDAEYFRTHYVPGDILYVREMWGKHPKQDIFYYRADSVCNGKSDEWGCPEPYDKTNNCILCEWCDGFIKWRPSIHMPKSAARIFLKVTDVRCERLQNITVEQALKEGFNSAYEFNILWDKTISKKDIPLYNWQANPWVWVYEFERICTDD